jgi:acetyltransferase-like isoleucine patch superfamily enzyme
MRARSLISALVNEAWKRLCVLGAVGPDDPGSRRFHSFGVGSCLAFPPGNSFGEEWIDIGCHTLIGPNVTMSAGMFPGQEMLSRPVVRIGDRCVIGRGSHIVGHLRIEIGDDVMTGPYVYITDQNHGYRDIDEPIGTQRPSEKPVSIGAGSWIGTGAMILPGACIGEHVVVAAGAVVNGFVPPRCVVAGVPARIVSRHIEGVGWAQRPSQRPPNAGRAALRSLQGS